MTYRKAVEKDLKSVAELFDSYRVFYKKESDFNSAEKFIFERLKTMILKFLLLKIKVVN